MKKQRPTSAKEERTRKPKVSVAARLRKAATGPRVERRGAISSLQLHDWLAADVEYSVRAEAS